MNPSLKITNLYGKEPRKSYPSQEEIDALPKINDKNQPDMEKLERETVGNMLINCLANYKPDDRKEIIYVNVAMQLLLTAEKGKDIELKEKIKNFLIKVVQELTIRDIAPDPAKPNIKEEVGIYQAWATSQLLQELGVSVPE